MPDQLLQPPLAQAPLPAALSPLTAAGRPRTIHNPTIGDYATFLRSTEETGGESVLIRIQLPARGGARLARHIHLQSRENFVVTEGELTIEKGSDVAVLKVGDSAVVEPGDHHRYLSTSDLPCVFEVELRPAGKSEDGLRVIYGLARDGKCAQRGEPQPSSRLAARLISQGGRFRSCRARRSFEADVEALDVAGAGATSWREVERRRLTGTAARARPRRAKRCCQATRSAVGESDEAAADVIGSLLISGSGGGPRLTAVEPINRA